MKSNGREGNGSGHHDEQPTGPRGGTTTVTKSGMVKKNLWIPQDEAEALRVKAFQERRSEADIIREGLRVVLEEEPVAAAAAAD